MDKKDCIVMGGGIIGMATARELALRGLSVSLFDKGKLGREASWAAGGILSSMRPWSETPNSVDLSNQGKAYYPEFIRNLKAETGVDPEYYRSGLLIINGLDIEYTKKWANENQVVYSDFYDAYPVGMNIPDKTLFLSEIAQVRPPCLLNALRGSLVNYDVEIYEDTTITHLDNRYGHCVFLKAGEKQYYADAFIITAGPWSKKLLTKGSENLTIKPVHGQMLCMKFPEQQLSTMILDGAHYLIPRMDGHVLVGSTMEDTGFIKDTTHKAREQLMGWASTIWPDIRHADFVQHWSGLRPATASGQPYIGKLAAYDNVYINAGHFRKGILQAPICARNLADVVFENVR